MSELWHMPVTMENTNSQQDHCSMRWMKENDYKHTVIWYFMFGLNNDNTNDMKVDLEMLLYNITLLFVNMQWLMHIN